MSRPTGKIYVITPDGSIPADPIASPAKDLAPFQKAVAAPNEGRATVERVKVRFLGKLVFGYANENGYALGLPLNREASKLAGQSIVGNFAIYVPDPKPVKLAPSIAAREAAVCAWPDAHGADCICRKPVTRLDFVNNRGE